MKLLLHLFIFTFITSYGQDYSYVHYDTKNGLVGNYVYDALQDKDGFMWFATETGVSRFDGSQFTNFTTTDGLPDNDIIKLFVDSKNRIWILPFKNKICYYKNGKIYNSDSILKKFHLTNNPINVVEDKNGTIAIVEKTKILLLYTSGQIKEVSQLNNAPLNIINGGLNENGEFTFFLNDEFANTTLSLYELDSSSNFFLAKQVKIKNANLYYSQKDAAINMHGIMQSGINGNGNTRIILSTTDNKYYDPVLSKNIKINTVALFSDKVMYINTKNGSLKYDFITGKITESFLTEECVSATFTDTEKNLWFCTLGNGIFMMPNKFVKTLKFENEGKAQIQSISYTNSSIIAGSSENKCYIINLVKRNAVEEIELDKKATGRIIKILKFKATLLFLTEYGLFSSDSTLRRWRKETPGITHSFKDMDISTNGDILFSTHSSVLIKEFGKSLSENKKIFKQRSTAISVTDSGNYVGSINGLYFVNTSTNQSTFLGNKDPLLKNRITKLLAYKNYLMVGTNDNGLIFFDGKKILKKISAKEGLSGNIIRSLFGTANYLWIGTDKGLSKIDVNNPEFPVVANYSSLDGLASSMINGVYVDGNMVYVATSSGISFFDESQMTNESICLLNIKTIQIKGKKTEVTDSLIQLSNTDNSIAVEFSGISYKSVGNMKYCYRLLGVDDNAWKKTSTPSLQYLSLPSGNYQLEIKAINAFGKESNTAIIRFVIEKKMTEKIWFRILIAFIVSTLLWLLFRYRLQQVRRKEKIKAALKRRITDLEQLALKSQMNPHFIFNCLNSIQQYVIEKDVNGANKFISNFSKLIRQTLDNSGKPQISLAEEENFITYYLQLEKIRFEDKFEYSVKIDEAIKKNEVFLPPMLLQPYVENSIRHGIRLKKDSNGFIEVAINQHNDFLIIKITDNGVGRKEAAEYKSKQHIQYQSKGMYLTEKRIDLFNKTINKKIEVDVSDASNEEGFSDGTCVTIKFPINKDINIYSND